MSDNLRIVDAPELPYEELTDDVKIPTGGKGNYSVKTKDLVNYTVETKNLANKSDVQTSSNGVKAIIEAHKNDKSNPHGVTKSQIGLGNVNNTADLDKPVSSATQAAIISANQGKADKVYVDIELGKKANSQDVVNSLNTKEDKTVVTNLRKLGGVDYWDGGTYPLNGEVRLDNGQIVKSTIANNTKNPNIDMTGWVSTNQKMTVSTINDLVLLSGVRGGDIVHVLGFGVGNFSLLNPYDGGGDFVWIPEIQTTPVQGIVEQIKGVENGRFIRIIYDNIVNVLYCGADRNGLKETHNELKIALQYAIDNNMRCYAPSGTYLLGNRVDPTFSNGKSLYFYGDGSELTVFKERDGLTLELGRYNMSFYFLCPDNSAVETMFIKGMRVDKNGVTSPAPSPTDYAYEQAHCFGLASTWVNSRVKNLIIEDVVTEDKIGAGICLTQGYFDIVRIRNIKGVNYQHIGGERGDFEFQAVVADLEVDTGVGRYAQCEPNMLAVSTGYNPKAKFTNCSYDVTEFTAYVNTPDAQTIILDNHTANELCLIRWAKVIATNSTLRVRSSSNTYWEGTVKGSKLKDCKIVISINTTTNATDPFYLRSATNVPSILKIEGGSIVPDNTINATTTGFAINNAALYSGAQDYMLELDGVEIDQRFERTVNCYANGNYKIKNTKLAGRSGLAAVAIGGYSTYYANVELDSNDLSQLGGVYVQYTASNTLWSVNYKGVHDFNKSSFTSSNLSNTEACAKADGYFTSDAVPTGKGILGWRVKINKPMFGTGSEFICTATHSVTPTYQLSAQAGVKMDTTVNRPSGLTVASRGLRYLDTTLAVGGKPLQYNGSSWVDSLGTVV